MSEFEFQRLRWMRAGAIVLALIGALFLVRALADGDGAVAVPCGVGMVASLIGARIWHRDLVAARQSRSLSSLLQHRSQGPGSTNN